MALRGPFFYFLWSECWVSLRVVVPLRLSCSSISLGLPSRQESEKNCFSQNFSFWLSLCNSAACPTLGSKPIIKEENKTKHFATILVILPVLFCFFFFIKEENKTKNFTTILVILQVLTSPSSHPGIIYFTFQSSQAVTSSEFLATINGRDRM